MIEIRFHGRGGQGAVIASELLAHAAFEDGLEPQSFPFFGVERRGAPVTAYARVDQKPIGVRTSIERPDIVVVLDPGLLKTTPVTDGIKDGGLLLVNSKDGPEKLTAPPSVRRATVDATRIALAHKLGSPTLPIVNTAILGALAQASGIVTLHSVEHAIESHVPARPKENSAAAADGFHEVKLLEGTNSLTGSKVRPGPALLEMPEGPVATVPSEKVYKTASWRTLTPVIHLEKCTKCNFCWKFCPDDAIAFDAHGYPVIRLDWCKGCGICARECPPHTIEMVEEA